MTFFYQIQTACEPYKQLCKNIIKYTCDISSILFAFFITAYILSSPSFLSPIENVIFLTLIALTISFFLEIHHHLWRSISFYNFRYIAKYALCVSLVYMVGCVFFTGFSEDLIKFLVVFLLFSFSFLSVVRILVRMFYEQNKLLPQEEKTKLILIGAGKGGELFLRESRKRQQDFYSIEGILDDNPELWGKKIFGFKVYGPIKDLPKLASHGNADAVAIAIPSLNTKKLLEISQVAKELNLGVKVLPSFSQLLTSKHAFSEDISVENLLGRESVCLENEEVSCFISNKTIMVTGAGGSIGSEVCRQLIKFHPKTLILVDHSEFNLYSITWELENTFKFTDFITVIGSVTDKNIMSSTFEATKPQIIFHAAAYKHVPLLENQVNQAVQNNFFGTKVIADLATQQGCEKFIFVSTDKAVNSTNVMGTTKRMAEMLCQDLNEKAATKFITVRFGNVLESAGSVIPLFKKQLKQGGPLTVTHPEITRFFMSIPEASQLVLEAGAMGKGGEIYVLDMGEPIKISVLAERLITLSGKRPYKDIDITFTGLRPGEKLFEELFYENETHIPTKRDKILLAQSKTSNSEHFAKYINDLETYLYSKNTQNIIKTMCKMVPEATLQPSENS